MIRYQTRHRGDVAGKRKTGLEEERLSSFSERLPSDCARRSGPSVPAHSCSPARRSPARRRDGGCGTDGPRSARENASIEKQTPFAINFPWTRRIRALQPRRRALPLPCCSSTPRITRPCTLEDQNLFAFPVPTTSAHPTASIYQGARTLWGFSATKLRFPPEKKSSSRDGCSHPQCWSPTAQFGVLPPNTSPRERGQGHSPAGYPRLHHLAWPSPHPVHPKQPKFDEITLIHAETEEQEVFFFFSSFFFSTRPISNCDCSVFFFLSQARRVPQCISSSARSQLLLRALPSLYEFSLKSS